MRLITLTFLLLIFSNSASLASGAFPLDDHEQVLVGINQKYVIKDRETLIELARVYDVGYNEITASNISIDPWVPPRGTRILLPTSWVLPGVYREGVIINLPEMRLYYYPVINDRLYVITYPIGIGRQGFNTPLGIFSITAKVKDPTWYVPEKIRKENPELPLSVPTGPDNPLGSYWLQLSRKGYGLHGANMPYGIGRKVSHGCIRLYPEDIKVLFGLVKPGTKVKIIDEPVKVGLFDNKVYIEVHGDYRPESELISLATKKLRRKNLLKYVNSQLLVESIKNATGLPADISKSSP